MIFYKFVLNIKSCTKHTVSYTRGKNHYIYYWIEKPRKTYQSRKVLNPTWNCVKNSRSLFPTGQSFFLKSIFLPFDKRRGQTFNCFFPVDTYLTKKNLNHNLSWKLFYSNYHHWKNGLEKQWIYTHWNGWQSKG